MARNERIKRVLGCEDIVTGMEVHGSASLERDVGPRGLEVTIHGASRRAIVIVSRHH